MTHRAYYDDSITDFLQRSSDEILGTLVRNSAFAVEEAQRNAWLEQITLLKESLSAYDGRGKVYFEYAVPRLGKRIDVVVLLDHVIFILEFKVGEKEFLSSARDQVWDYAVDLKNFHETTHDKTLAPVLLPTRAPEQNFLVATTAQNDGVLLPINSSTRQLKEVLERVLQFSDGPRIDAETWEAGGYPFVITRDLGRAKVWLKMQARGTERYGMIVSSQAQRLKPHAIDVKSPMDPIHWFLDGKEDVRSSFYLEDVATEFHVQGLEVDWACVVWDGDFRYARTGWQHFSFVGDRWQHIRKAERQVYLKNAYRVLLTRARQGMVVVIPEGDANDPTRARSLRGRAFSDDLIGEFSPQQSTLWPLRPKRATMRPWERLMMGLGGLLQPSPPLKLAANCTSASG